MSSNPKVTRWLKKEYPGWKNWKYAKIDYDKWAKDLVAEFKRVVKRTGGDAAHDAGTDAVVSMIVRSPANSMVYDDHMANAAAHFASDASYMHDDLKPLLIADAMPKKRAAKKKGSSSKKKKSPNGAAKKGSSSKRTRCRNGYRRNKKTGKCEKKKKK